MTQEPGVGPELDIATVLDAIAARHPDTECLVFRDRRLTWAEVVRPHRPPRRVPARPAVSAATPSGPSWPATRPARTTWPSTCTTASSTSSRCSALEGPGRAVQRQLPLRRRGAAATCSPTPAPRPSSCTRASRRRWPRCSPDLPRAARDRPGPRRQRPRPAARRGLVRRRAGRGVARAAAGRRRSPDDLYILYTGGTTGHAQGRAVAQRRRHDRVLRRLADGAARSTTSWPRPTTGMQALITPPFMHGAGHWVALSRVARRRHGRACSSTPEHLDPADVWALVERERIEFMLIVGDAFARPLLDELDRHDVRPVEPQRHPVRRRRAVRRRSSRSCSPTCRR